MSFRATCPRGHSSLRAEAGHEAQDPPHGCREIRAEVVVAHSLDRPSEFGCSDITRSIAASSGSFAVRGVEIDFDGQANRWHCKVETRRTVARKIDPVLPFETNEPGRVERMPQHRFSVRLGRPSAKTTIEELEKPSDPGSLRRHEIDRNHAEIVVIEFAVPEHLLDDREEIRRVHEPRKIEGSAAPAGHRNAVRPSNDVFWTKRSRPIGHDPRRHGRVAGGCGEHVDPLITRETAKSPQSTGGWTTDRHVGVSSADRCTLCQLVERHGGDSVHPFHDGHEVPRLDEGPHGRGRQSALLQLERCRNPVMGAQELQRLGGEDGHMTSR
jgi:hypothetical protein